MNCSEFREMLSPYIDNMLPEKERLSMEKHLSSCGGCKAEYEDLKSLQYASAALPVLPLPAGLHDEIMASISAASAVNLAEAVPSVSSPASSNPFKKYRSVLYGGAAAACVLLVASFLLNPGYDSSQQMTNMASEAAPMDSKQMSPFAEAEYAEYALTEEAADAMPAEEGFAAADTADLAAGNSLDSTTPAADENLKIIKTANYSLEVEDFDSAIAKIEAFAKQNGGYVESYNHYVYNSIAVETASRDLREGFITLKIPANQYEGAKSSIQGIGKVLTSDEYVENITNSYVDVEARLAVKKTEEQRLLTLLEKAEKIEDLIALESRLTLVRSDIEAMTAQLRNWDRSISYSTLHISLKEVYNYSKTSAEGPSMPEKLRDAFKQSVNSFLYSMERLLLWLAENAIALIIIIGLVLVFAIPLRKFLQAKK